jgi:hypothetical protein
MTAYFNGQPKTQVTEILYDMRVYTEDEIRSALKEYGEKHPVKRKKKGKK